MNIALLTSTMMNFKRGLSDKKCLICNKGITTQDIENNNFEQVGKNFIHTSCFNNHIPRLGGKQC